MAPALRTRAEAGSFGGSFDLTTAMVIELRPLSKCTNIQMHKYTNIKVIHIYIYFFQ
jgi:hypothetical protein